MAKNGFGTRSAYKLGPSTSSGDVKAAEASSTETAPSAEEPKTEDKDVWTDSPSSRAIARTDSQTPSSEDSFFLGSGGGSSRPDSGTGGLMKHGSESAISEELHTPDPSTTHLLVSLEGKKAAETDGLVASDEQGEQQVAVV